MSIGYKRYISFNVVVHDSTRKVRYYQDLLLKSEYLKVKYL
jgi:hypothetical protein